MGQTRIKDVDHPDETVSPSAWDRDTSLWTLADRRRAGSGPWSTRSSTRTRLLIGWSGLLVFVGVVIALLFVGSPKAQSPPRVVGFQALPAHRTPLLTRHTQNWEALIFTAGTGNASNRLSYDLTIPGASIAADNGTFSLRPPTTITAGFAFLAGTRQTEIDVDVYEVANPAITEMRAVAGGRQLDETAPTLVRGDRLAVLLLQPKNDGPVRIEGLSASGAVLRTSQLTIDG